MKSKFGFLFVAVLGMMSQWIAEPAYAIGTKFACCRPESVSCLGGGGATVWHRTLEDRALTQVDAKARCGFHRMNWNTHSCPSDTSCSSQPGVTPNPVTPVTPANRVSIRNDLSTKAFIVVKRLNPGNRFTTNAWYELEPGQSREYTFSTKACVGISVNGVDRIKQQQDSGSIFTGEVSQLWVHPSRRTDLSYNQAGSSFTMDLSLDGGAFRYQNSGMSAQSLAQTLDSNGLVRYRCKMAESGYNHLFVD